MTPTPQTFVADIANLPRPLRHITTLKRWVVWRWEARTGKNGAAAWTKPPYQCAHPNTPAKSDAPRTWDTYEAALAAVAAGSADGIGFMLKDSEVAAADLDHVRDARTGELTGWAERLCGEADSLGLYREVTVSGSGLRFIGLAQGSKLHRKFTVNRKTGCGIELYRNCARYITISGLQEGSCEELGPIDGYLDTLLARFDAKTFDFNTAGPQQPDRYREIIANGVPEGERSEKFQETVWHLAAAGESIEQIVDELARHPNGIGSKYAGRLAIEVTRSFDKWRSRRQTGATGAPAAAANAPWPQIRIKPGEIPRVVNEAEEALLLLGREIYQRGGMLVRPVLTTFKASKQRAIDGWTLVPLSRPWLVDTLGCAAQFMKHDARSKGWVSTDAPDKVAEIYLARQGRWRVPALTGIIHTPFLRTDGSICETPGYDAVSGLLFKPDGETFPPVPHLPSRDDAHAALDMLDGLIATFPFVRPVDRAVALAALLTVLDRRSMPTAPLFGYTSPAAGTGKSLLVDIAAVLATGRPMPVIAQGRGEEELEKRLGAALIAGDSTISIDNCEHPLQSALLCQILTQQKINVRLLGLSRNVETPVNATLFCTGNNLTVVGDLTRRTLMCALDARCERPELRAFDGDLIATVRAERGRLVVSGLTVLRAWTIAREREKIGLVPFGGFEAWSQRVREALVWLGCADPCETTARIRNDDPRLAALTAVLEQWRENLTIGSLYTVQEVINRAVNTPSFHTALVNVAGTRGAGALVSNDRLGRWLKSVEGRVVNRLVLRKAGMSAGYPTWHLLQE
jgi:hypothetical protein